LILEGFLGYFNKNFLFLHNGGHSHSGGEAGETKKWRMACATRHFT